MMKTLMRAGVAGMALALLVSGAGCFNVMQVTIEGGTGGAGSGGSGGPDAGAGGAKAGTGGGIGAGTGGAGKGTGGGVGTGGSVGTGGLPAGSGGAAGTGGVATGSGGVATGTGGAPGSGGAPAGTGGIAGTGGAPAGTGGAACGVVFDTAAHHLGDGAGTEGISLSRTFTLNCACSQPWLSFQIDQPSYEQPPSIMLNGTTLPSLQSFFPSLSAPGWQTNAGNTHDYNLYMQIHYDVTGKLAAPGSVNTFTITNGSTADDYEFKNLRIECGSPTTPPGPDIVSRGGWIGTDPSRSDDDPLGLQGAYYSFGDGLSCVPQSNPCGSGACCMSGATSGSDPKTNWGCGMGLDLHSANNVSTPYPGAAKCFIVELTGSSGPSSVTVSANDYSDMTGRRAPFIDLGPISGYTKKTICFTDFTCPSDDPTCSLSGNWYNLQWNIIGGHASGQFNLCLSGLTMVP